MNNWDLYFTASGLDEENQVFYVTTLFSYFINHTTHHNHFCDDFPGSEGKLPIFMQNFLSTKMTSYLLIMILVTTQLWSVMMLVLVSSGDWELNWEYQPATKSCWLHARSHCVLYYCTIHHNTVTSTVDPYFMLILWARVKEVVDEFDPKYKERTEKKLCSHFISWVLKKF